MGPSVSVVQRATTFFSDPATRPRLRQWLEAEVPFLEMIRRLGYADLVDDELRAVLEGLTPEEVSVIRGAAIAEIDRLGEADDTAVLPIDCTLTQIGPVTVTSGSVDGRAVAVVVAKTDVS